MPSRNALDAGEYGIAHFIWNTIAVAGAEKHCIHWIWLHDGVLSKTGLARRELSERRNELPSNSALFVPRCKIRPRSSELVFTATFAAQSTRGPETPLSMAGVMQLCGSRPLG